MQGHWEKHQEEQEQVATGVLNPTSLPISPDDGEHGTSATGEMPLVPGLCLDPKVWLL